MVGCYSQPINPYIFAPDVATQADNITFVGGNNRQFVEFEETANSGKALVAFLADFYRECKVGAITKTETDDRMGDCFPHPIRHDKIHVTDLRYPVGPLLPIL